jgi:hypothetical protein
VQGCTTGRGVGGSRALLRGKERGAADAVQEVRRELAVEEGLRAEQGSVDRDVGDDALDDELVERGPASAADDPQTPGGRTPAPQPDGIGKVHRA